MPFPANAFAQGGQSGGGIFYVGRRKRQAQAPSQPYQSVEQMAPVASGQAPPPQDFDGTPTVAPHPEVSFGYAKKQNKPGFLPSPESLAISGIGAAIGAGAFLPQYGTFGSKFLGAQQGFTPGFTAGVGARATGAGAVKGFAQGLSQGESITNQFNPDTSEGLSALIPPSDIRLNQKGVGGLDNPYGQFNVAFNPFNEENAETVASSRFGFSPLEDVRGVGPNQLNQMGGQPFGLDFNYQGYGSAGGPLGGNQPHNLMLQGSRDKYAKLGINTNDQISVTQALRRAAQALYGISKGTQGLGAGGAGFQNRITSGPGTLEEALRGIGSQWRGESYTPSQSYGNEIG